ncbi:MAG: hypothetical protein RBU45_13460 [Myxococcota bacterium]|nr:hypothetical protein [Myxococcota bacterium]
MREVSWAAAGPPPCATLGTVGAGAAAGAADGSGATDGGAGSASPGPQLASSSHVPSSDRQHQRGPPDDRRPARVEII